MSPETNPNIAAFDSEVEVLERLNSNAGDSYIDELRIIFSRLNLTAEEAGTIIDLGCSLGNSTRALLKAFPKVEIIGIDGSSKLISIARKRTEGVSRVKFLTSAFEDLRWNEMPNECAAVVAISSLEHVAPDVRRVIFQNIYNILRKGGVFLDKEWAKDTTPPGVDPKDRACPGNMPQHLRQAIEEGRITEEEHWRLWINSPSRIRIISWTWMSNCRPYAMLAFTK